MIPHADAQHNAPDADIMDRARRAAIAAGRFAGDCGADPVLLDSARHICLLLPELSIVARVFSAGERNIAAAKRELDVARYLAEKGMPVVGPSHAMPPEPLVLEEMSVTLWPFVPHEKKDDEDQEAVRLAARSLRQVHDALADYPGELPSLTAKFVACASQLRHPQALPVLHEGDNGFLLSIHDRLLESLAKLPVSPVPLHGDAWLGNVFFTPHGPLWTDFEAACLGPREWDAAGTPCPSAFPQLHPEILAIMTALRSVCTVVWCAGSPGDARKREAVDYHLARLKAFFLRPDE
ncbi:MAG: aminoglycoside phosphotransferase family protein [Rhizomicrobium sp.]